MNQDTQQLQMNIDLKNTEKVEADPNDKLFDALANVDAGLEGLFK